MANYAGIVVIDILTNKIIGEITYETTVEEIYDVLILTNTLKPGLISPDDERHKLAVTTKNISFWKKNK